jgi:hypothetical protein
LIFFEFFGDASRGVGVCRFLVAAIDSLDAIAIVIASITRLLKLSLFFWLSAARFARFADARDASSADSL